MIASDFSRRAPLDVAPAPSQKRAKGRAESLRRACVFDQPAFRRTLEVEEKRSERSLRRFVLMLVDCKALAGNDGVWGVAEALSCRTRETDVTGWYEQDAVIGTIFTEIGADDGHAVARALLDKVSGILGDLLSIDQLNEVGISFHVFPDDWNRDRSGRSVLYPDDLDNQGQKNKAIVFKRLLDIGISLSALILLAPVFAAISILIKLTSSGPVFFRQQRAGQGGHRFTFLKFRSMYTGNRSDLHEDFVKHLIRGDDRTADDATGKRVYKMVNDPRVTPIGRFLRKTSLDEIPQFINVLRGEMSVVGPRPPVPYEVSAYKAWHRRRLIPVKPGITGLWQVSGRSRVTFDEMVRLDLRYASDWSIWLDLKILLRTPLAILGGEGAY